MKNRLYIFDMGGVVSLDTDVFPEVFSWLHLSEAAFMSIAGENLDKLLTGDISTAGFWRQFSAGYGKPIQEELFGKFFKPRLNRGAVDIIKRLKTESRVVCGTNTFDPHYNRHLNAGDYDCFDAVYASNKIGYAKPDPRFFNHILETEGFLPEQAFFTDDTERYVAAAKDMGITAMVFNDAESLARALDRVRTG